MISPLAHVDASAKIGENVIIGENVQILGNAFLEHCEIGDNTVIENCIVESRDSIKPNSQYIGEPGKVKIVIEKSARYSF